MGADVAAVLDRAHAVLAELRDLDLDGVGDEVLSDAVLSLQRLRGCLEVAEARVLARWDAQGCWRASGAKTGAAWLAWKERVPIGVARQRIRHARALRAMPAVEEAWADGDIDRSHLVTLLGARTPRTAEVFDQDHKTLLDVARESSFRDFKRACDLFTQVVDPDGADDRAAEDRAAREVHLAFTVVVGLETLRGRVLELFNRTIITPGTAAAWLTEAYVERVVFDSPSRVIDVGAQRRFLTGALRRAIEVRDRSCYHPSCDEPPERLEIDHIHEHAKGGPTTQVNGRPACGFHNRWRNQHPDADEDPDDH